jgi:hypothetical protein
MNNSGKQLSEKNRPAEKQSAVPIGLLRMKVSRRLLWMIVCVI